MGILDFISMNLGNQMALWYGLTIVVILMLSHVVLTTNDKSIDFPGVGLAAIIGIYAILTVGSVKVTFGAYEDRGVYANSFLAAKNDMLVDVTLLGESVFNYYVHICARFFENYTSWFWLTAIIYVTNYFVASKRISGENMIPLFMCVLCSFSFYSYGTNTIRAGFAASFLWLALSYWRTPMAMYSLMLVSLGIHTSMIIPIIACVFAYRYDNPKYLLYAWLICIVVSFYAGSTFETFFGQFDTGGRAEGYFNTQGGSMYNTGFRWDFLAYSAGPALLGYYYLTSLNYKSKFYSMVYGGYMIANSFWVLVIRANYTDRFGYLSWLLMPIVLMYPLVDKKIEPTMQAQSRDIVVVMMCVYLFGMFETMRYSGLLNGIIY